MIELDHSDNEAQNETSKVEVSDNAVDNNKPAEKRLREESSEDESLHAPPKKVCQPVDEATPTEDTHEVNGTTESTNAGTEEDISAVDAKDKNVSVPEKTSDETTKESGAATDENIEAPISNDVKIEKENEESASVEPEQSSADDATVKEEGDEEENDLTSKKKPKKTRKVEDAEVVEGLELSVECASDKESSSSSENEEEKDKKPLRKTIIVKAKPNDSELDVSSSEAEKSDSQDTAKAKQTAKKGKRRGRKPSNKIKNSESEENENNISDEEYSPQTKRKPKKAGGKKKSPAGPKGTKKANRKSTEKKDEEDENSNIAEEKKEEENESDEESEKSRSEDDGDDDDSKDKNGRRRGSRPEDDRKIQVLKKYIRIAGIHVKSYNDLWAGCKSNAARARCLKELLAKNGITGRPTMEKCKKAKERNESLKDVAELNTSNIISEGRVTRAQRNKDSTKEATKSPETPTKRSKYKRVLSVVDSDSE